MRQWARRAAAIHGELAGLAELRDPRWWLVAGGAALPWQPRDTYVASDAEPAGDTFIGHVAAAPATPLVRAHAARAALRELDGQLPEQPLAVTIRRTSSGAIAVPSDLSVAAFAIGDRVVRHRLAARLEDETGAIAPADGVPFVTVSVGEEPLATARHGHRRGWTANGAAQGPWLGLGYAAGLSIVSTCHMIVDGYGHARLAGTVSKLSTARPPQLPQVAARFQASLGTVSTLSTPGRSVPLAVAWRELESIGAVRLAYALGQLLHRLAGRHDAPFSPTFQIPVAPGEQGDPMRMRRRVTPSLASVRFESGRPEPFDVFAARTRLALASEAAGTGVTSRLHLAAQWVPAPLAWKRRAVGSTRPRWLEPLAQVLGGRGCVSRIQLDVDVSPSVAVSSPGTVGDELGGCVVTVVEDRTQALITWAGSGRAGDPALLDELLALVPPR